MSAPQTAGDPVPPGCELIEVHVVELNQLFSSIDPSPFRERDLDPRAEEFIVSWAREAPPDVPLALRVHLDRSAGLPDEAAILRDAIHEFFSRQAESTRRQLRQLFRLGRVSLVIGLAFLAGSIGAGEAAVMVLSGWGVADLIRESLLIGGWVAMWRPLEIFLYDWWPIGREVRLFARLDAMPVSIVYRSDAPSDAWKSDWPAAVRAPRSARRNE